MLCPFCLDNVKVNGSPQTTEAGGGYECPNGQCRQTIPIAYVKDYRKFPPVVVSSVGFRAHGKTVYIASLFYLLKFAGIGKHWPYFHATALNQESLDLVYENVKMLMGGELPPATPQNFPRPTIIRIQGVPIQRNCTLLFYDTAGESFAQANRYVRFAGFVRRAKTALFLVSLEDMKNPKIELDKLLNTYFLGMTDLGGNTQDQHLAVVLTKADALAKALSGRPELFHYLTEGMVDGLAAPSGYMQRLYGISRGVRDYIETELGASDFLAATRNHFRSTTFSLVSALGAKPIGKRLPAGFAPRRVFDPLLVLMNKSTPSFWQRMRG